eukprot:m.1445349 g.1445349  ORF g.1445349 m.1445349 type:complete len:122 (-) comp25107_c0_seq20:2325-2690(-)
MLCLCHPRTPTLVRVCVSLTHTQRMQPTLVSQVEFASGGAIRFGEAHVSRTCHPSRSTEDAPGYSSTANAVLTSDLTTPLGARECTTCCPASACAAVCRLWGAGRGGVLVLLVPGGSVNAL